MAEPTKTPARIEIAKAVLKRILSDPLAVDGLKVETIHEIGRGHGLVKGEMKIARKEMGVISENRSGVQWWRLQR